MNPEFLRNLGVSFPIFQAPMAGVSTPPLAAAVSNAGGLGALAIGASTTDQARQMIEQTRALTARPFNVNVFCHEPAVRDAGREAAWIGHLEPLFAEVGQVPPSHLDEIYPTFLEDNATFQLLLETRPAVVSFHFGLPATEKIAALRNAGITTLATATNLSEALQLERAGVDGIVAQGIEAGGHRGVFDLQTTDEGWSTLVLVQLLTRQIQRPIIAAGGIMTGAGIQAMLDVGAVAAQLGTAFVLCPESAANAGYREVLKSSRAATTRLTSVFSGRPARGIVNRFLTHGEAPGAPPPAAYPLAYDGAKQLSATATSQGIHDFAAHWAGQGAPLARALPAAELVATLMQELNASRA